MNGFRFASLGVRAALVGLSAAILIAISASAVSVSYTTGSLDGQNGWNGGSPCTTFTNDDAGDEAVTNAVFHNGTQSWHYARGYGSPGCGTPFSPQLPISIGRPSSGAEGDMLIQKFAFKAGTPADQSSQNIYLGSLDRAERIGSNIYLSNDAGGVDLYMFVFVLTSGVTCDTESVPIASDLDATIWHTVKMTTQYHEDLTQDITTYVIDEGTPGETTVNAVSWMHPWKDCNASPYIRAASLKFSSSYDGATCNTNTNPCDGFYYDDVSLQVIKSSDSSTVGFFATGFEPTEGTVALEVKKDFSDTNAGAVTFTASCTNGANVIGTLSATEAVPASLLVSNIPNGGTTCTITETGGAAGYVTTYGGTDCTAGGLVTILPADSAMSCTIINTAQPPSGASVTVYKDFLPDDDADVSITLTCTGATPVIIDGTASESDPAEFTVGSIGPNARCTVSEPAMNDYYTRIVCGYGPATIGTAQGVSYTFKVKANDAIKCTFTNVQVPDGCSLVKVAKGFLGKDSLNDGIDCTSNKPSTVPAVCTLIKVAKGILNNHNRNDWIGGNDNDCSARVR